MLYVSNGEFILRHCFDYCFVFQLRQLVKMEWNWRTFIIVMGLVLIVGIVADGLRRMRRNREHALRLDIDEGFIDRADYDNPELPNGGWRVANSTPKTLSEENELVEPILIEDDFSEEAEFQYIDTLVADPELKAEAEADVNIEAEITSEIEAEVEAEAPNVQARPVNLDERVPLLIDVEQLGSEEENPEVGLENQYQAVAMTVEQDEFETAATEDTLEEIEIEAAELEAMPELDEIADSSEGLEAEDLVEEQLFEEPQITAAELINYPDPDAEKLRDRTEAEDTLVIHCITPLGHSLDGSQVLNLFKNCDLRLGDDNIFHRYELAEGKGNIQFSVVHSYEPQTFNIEKMLDQNFHGFSFFMRLPGPKEPLQAYDTMLSLAQFIEEHFDADLYDIDRSALTQQTISHDRQQIIDFERRQQVAAKKLMRG